MDLDLAINCVQKQITALESIKNIICTSQYKKLLDLSKFILDNNGTICICGVGKNANIAAKISESMASLGIRSKYINCNSYMHGDAGFIEKNDLVIYISKSGTTNEILMMNAHMTLERPEIKQVLIHCSINEIYLDNTFTIQLKDVIEGDKFNLAPTTSTTTFLCFLDTITVVLSNQLGFTKDDFFKFHPGGALGKRLQEELYGKI